MFQLAYTPLIWPFVISLIITACLAIYASRRRHLHAASAFTMLMITLTIWTFCYIMELSSVALNDKVFWTSAKYFGSAPGPVAWFVLALYLTKNERWLTPPVYVALWTFVSVTCFVVFTNEYHHWFWTRMLLVPSEPELQTDHGFYFWIYAACIYALVVTSLMLFIQYYRTTPLFYRRQAFLIALGGFIPFGGRLPEDFLQIDLIPKVDNIILLFLLSGVLFAIAIFRYGALDIVHIANNLVVQTIGAGIIVTDMEQRVLDINPYAMQFVRHSHIQTIGQPVHNVLEGWPELAITSGEEQEVAVPSATGERWFHLQSSQIKAENGEAAGYAVVLFDITARKHAEQQLSALAQLDALTGLTNRRYFYEQATAAFERAQRYEHPLAVMMLDIDHFKTVNDTFGHLAGDAVIQRTAVACRNELRGTDILARYGGEEFICLLEESTTEDACLAAERIRQVIADAQIEFDGHIIPLTISIGIASMLRYETNLEGLIHQADQALYMSKTNGRNRASLWPASQPEAPALAVVDVQAITNVIKPYNVRNTRHLTRQEL